MNVSCRLDISDLFTILVDDLVLEVGKKRSECRNPSLLNLRWADTFAQEKHEEKREKKEKGKKEKKEKGKKEKTKNI